MVSYYQVQQDYTYDVALMQNSWYNNCSVYHDEKLTEKIFEALYFNFMLESTFTTSEFQIFL